MKVDREVQEKVVASVRRWIEDLPSDIESNISAMENADTVEELMDGKRGLLYSMVSDLPLGHGHCYFCEIYHGECKICEYGKVHGHCIQAGNGSDFDKITSAHAALKEAIKHYHLSGTRYDEVDMNECVDNSHKEEEKEESRMGKSIIVKKVNRSGETMNVFMDNEGESHGSLAGALRDTYENQGEFYSDAVGVNMGDAESMSWHPYDNDFGNDCAGWFRFIEDKGMLESTITIRTLDAEDTFTFLLHCASHDTTPEDIDLETAF